MTRTFGPNAPACLNSRALPEKPETAEEMRSATPNTSSLQRANSGRLDAQKSRRVIARSPAECERENRRRKKALNRARRHMIRRARQLAKMIMSCRPIQPCDSPACAHCAQRVCDWFIPATTAFLSADNGHFVPVSITIIPANERVSWRRMDRWDLNGFVRRLKTRLNVISPNLLLCAAGAVDISLNRDVRDIPLDQRYWVHFSPHLHLGGLTTDPKALKRAPRALFPRDPVHVKVPVKVLELDADDYPISYFMRVGFLRREHYTDSTGKTDIRKDPLRTTKRLELQPVLIAIGKNTAMARGFFFRCRLAVDGPDAPKIVPIPVSYQPTTRQARVRRNRVYRTRRVKP